jgi:proteasome lid subunit RPN8/RPN11
MTFEGTEIPDDLRVEEVVEDLVDQLELPRVANSTIVKYSLLLVNDNYLLPNSESLLSAGVIDGAVLRLISAAETETNLPPSLASANISSSKPSKSPQTLRIFLCHSSGDKETVRALYKRLRIDGFDPWLDEENLLPGQDWNQEIIRAVRNSDVVLVCLSEKAISRAGYVQKEIKYALDVADEQPDGAMFLIPVRLEECDVPQRLGRWQWVNCFEEQGYPRLLMALEVKATQMSLHVAQDRNPNPKSNEEEGHAQAFDLGGFHPIREEPFPFSRIIHWTPRDVGREIEISEGNQPNFYLVLTQEVLLRVSEHVNQSLETELGGFLLGNRYRCPNTNVDYVIVDHVSEAMIVEATEFSFGPTSESWMRLSDELRGKFKGKLVLGWYHSHPRMDVFLSRHDLTLHHERFNKPWMTALVIDPVKHAGGFFCWINGQVDPNAPVGFYELVENSTKETAVEWANYIRVDGRANVQSSPQSLNTNSVQTDSPTTNSRGTQKIETDGPEHSEPERSSGLSKIYKDLANLTKRGRFIKPERSDSKRVSELIKIYEDLINLTERSKFIKCVAIDIEPYHSHEKYIITFTCLGIAGIDLGGEPQFSEFHQVSMCLPGDYSSLGPVLKWLTPIWHPNIQHQLPHNVSPPPYDPLHEDWRTQSIGELVIALGEMVQYKRYHAELSPPYPSDLEVARWVLEYAEPKGILNKGKPIDRRSLVQT